MKKIRIVAAAAVVGMLGSAGYDGALAADTVSAPTTMADVLAASKPADWRPLDPQLTLYMDLEAGQVIIELAPDFAPRHVANVIALVRGHYFDGLAFMRSQDNYVVQWGDADGTREIHNASKTLKAEFARPAKGLPFTALPDKDTFAPEVGLSNGFATARDSASNTAWLTHCYGTLGAGRDNEADSGGGTELYVVIGHSPRHLDRNVTLLGRVIRGMEILSTLHRGTGPQGFYEKPADRVPIKRIRVAADLPENERVPLEVLRTDTPTFTALVNARRNRSEEWFKYKANHVDVCNVPMPARAIKAATG